MAVAHVRSNTLTGDPYTTVLDSTVGEGVAEVKTERSTTERWPIAAGTGSVPSTCRSRTGAGLCASGRTATRADTATQKSHHTYPVT